MSLRAFLSIFFHFVSPIGKKEIKRKNQVSTRKNKGKKSLKNWL
jgi:hypothetical protein